MARGLNRQIIIGNLGKDPEIRYTADNKPIATFSVAANEQWRDSQGEKRERTEWFDCTVFGKLAEPAAEYLKKGSSVYLETERRTEEYEKDGQKRRAFKYIVSVMRMLGDAGGGDRRDERPAQRPAQQWQRPAPRQREAPPPDDFEDDMPF